jgi:hypothetical protein
MDSSQGCDGFHKNPQRERGPPWHFKPLRGGQREECEDEAGERPGEGGELSERSPLEHNEGISIYTGGCVGFATTPQPRRNSPKSRWMPKRENFPELGNNVLTSSLKIPQQRAQNVKLPSSR